jgi:hypothetical protein
MTTYRTEEDDDMQMMQAMQELERIEQEYLNPDWFAQMFQSPRVTPTKYDKLYDEMDKDKG